ncbi:MAG TPA: DNA replication and repair protein RecF [Bacteroidales bacterium]|jgi:DNA replication and repair protein RecF|nr:DNA replication and repair protein RecF [Bacteroidales bacterium]
MYLESVSLIDFKNFPQAELSFSPRINCFVGNNGVGKTNLLDAIHYLCLCKSYFNPVDSQNILHGKEFSVIQGAFKSNGSVNEIYCGIHHNKNKIFKKNKKEYEKLAHHIGLFPVVMISPQDSSLIMEGSEERRRFLNNVISQYDHTYLEDVMQYNRILAQRNKLLRDAGWKKDFDAEMLDIYDSQLLSPGKRIFESRSLFAEKMIPVFTKYYYQISSNFEEVELQYTSQLSGDDFEYLLKNSREKDRIMQYTTQGIHKDDLLLKINGYSLKKTGSQGQQKTFLVTLKLAQFDFIKDMNKTRPILLLDDVFDKFDESRVRQIIQQVSDQHFGQIFITHTDPQKMKSILEEMNTDYKLFHIENGRII